MTKVKVFVVKQGLPHSHEKLEFQINQFLEENDIEVVDIKYSTCSCSDTRGGGIWTPSAMLIYKTKE
jgi:hypothetical protein